MRLGTAILVWALAAAAVATACITHDVKTHAAVHQHREVCMHAISDFQRRHVLARVRSYHDRKNGGFLICIKPFARLPRARVG